jgi:hypothetical protein
MPGRPQVSIGFWDRSRRPSHSAPKIQSLPVPVIKMVCWLVKQMLDEIWFGFGGSPERAEHRKFIWFLNFCCILQYVHDTAGQIACSNGFVEYRVGTT